MREVLRVLSFARECFSPNWSQASLKKIHTIQSVSFVDFQRDALFSSKVWRQLENTGKEQKLAMICHGGWEMRKDCATGGRKLVPRIFPECWGLCFLQQFSGAPHGFTSPSSASNLGPPFPKMHSRVSVISTCHHCSPPQSTPHIRGLLLHAQSSTCFPR